MVKYDFDQPVNRKNTQSYKWDQTERLFGSQDILPMWVADMDFPSPPEVIEALKQRADHGIFGYTLRSPEYYEAIAEWIEKRHGWTVHQEWLCYSPGVVTALSLLVSCLTEPEDKVIIQTPVYPPFYSVVKNNKRELVTNPLLLRNGRYEMDFEGLEGLIDSKVKLLILCSPHNPVGRVWSRDELDRLGEICLKNNIKVITDEIHSDLVFKPNQHIPYASLSDEHAVQSITCVAPSKTFNMAGLKTSTIIIPDPQIRRAYKERLTTLSLELESYFGSTATEAAYRMGEEWLEELLIYLKNNLEYLKEYIKSKIPAIKVIESEGTYLVWLDCRELGFIGKQLKDFMIKEAKLGLNDGTTFGSDGEGFMRLNFACPRSILVEGLERLESAVRKQLA